MKAFIKKIDGPEMWTSLRAFDLKIGQEVDIVAFPKDSEDREIFGISFISGNSTYHIHRHWAHRSQLIIPHSKK